MIARIKLWYALRRRKAYRKHHAAITKQGQLAAQRKRRACDPLLRSAQLGVA